MDVRSLPATGIVLPEYDAWAPDELVEFGERAVEAGFGSVWCGETWGTNPFQVLAILAHRIDRPVGTVIANAFARSPASLAMNAATLHDLSDGRFALGIGASTPAIVEGLHGAPFERPLRRLRETMEIVRMALSGEPIEYDGEIFDLGGFGLARSLSAGESVPVLNAALGPGNLSLTADFADGWLPHLVPREGIERLHAEALDGREDGDAVHVAPSIVTSVHPDGERAREVLRSHVAYYLGASDFYRSIVARFGFADEADGIERAWAGGDADAAAAAVSEELLRAIGIVGAPEEVQAQFEAVRADPVDTVLVSFPRNTTDEMIDATLAAFEDVLDSST